MENTEGGKGDLLEAFDAYRQTVDLLGVKLSSVPENMRPLVKQYRDLLSSMLEDPENQSWDSIGPYQQLNALQAVRRSCREQPPEAQPRGNCPRCGGTGYLFGYGHIKGGICFQCGGTRNIKV